MVHSDEKMPYIPPQDRAAYEHTLNELCTRLSSSEDLGAHLNYVISYLATHSLPKNARYQDYADALAAFEGAKLEFYRRHVAPYEDIKLDQNGDL